jgi:hypothetical protein
MSVLFSKITTKSQTIVPKEARGALGDMLVYRIAKGKVSLARAEPLDRGYLNAVESTLSKWVSPEDAAAYDML